MSTKKKDSKPGCVVEPSLSSAYRKAMWEVYGISVRVAKSTWDKFTLVEGKLRSDRISVHDYALTVARLWKSWCRGRNLSHLPINVFLGSKSREWYANVTFQDLTHTDASRDATIILNDEVTVGMTIIGSILAGYVPTLVEIVPSLKLSKQWKECRERPIMEAVRIICGIVGVDVVSYTYEEVAKRMYERQVRVE